MLLLGREGQDSEMNDDLTTMDKLIATSKRPVAVFVGSGLSIADPTALPLANEAIVSLLNLDWVDAEEKFSYTEDLITKNTNLYKIRFEHLLSTFQEWNRHDFGTLLKQFADAEPNWYHEKIARLFSEAKLSLIITTNFDSCLEKALEKNKILPKIIINEQYISNTNPRDGVNVFKIHGSISRDEKGYHALGLGATLESIYSGLREWKEQLLINILDTHTVVFLGYSGSDSYDINPVLLSHPSPHLLWVMHKTGDVEKPIPPEVKAILSKSVYKKPVQTDTAEFLGGTCLPRRTFQFKFTPTYEIPKHHGHPSKFVGRVLESVYDYKAAKAYYTEVIWSSTGSNYFMIDIIDLFRHRAVCCYELGEYSAALGSLTMAKGLLADYMRRMENDPQTPKDVMKRISLDQYLLLNEEEALVRSALGEHETAREHIQVAFNCLEALDWDENTKSSVKSRLMLNRCTIQAKSNEVGYGDRLIAIHDLEATVKLKEEVGDVVGLIKTLGMLGRVYLSISDIQSAETAYLRMFAEIQMLKTPVVEQIVDEGVEYMSLLVYARLENDPETIKCFLESKSQTKVRIKEVIGQRISSETFKGNQGLIDRILDDPRLHPYCSKMKEELTR